MKTPATQTIVQRERSELDAKSQAQKEPTPRPAACDSQGHGVGTFNEEDSSEPHWHGNDAWETSELDDHRWTLAPLLDLGEISSEDRPGSAGGALLALARDVAAAGRARRRSRFATLAPWDADGPDDDGPPRGSGPEDRQGPPRGRRPEAARNPKEPGPAFIAPATVPARGREREALPPTDRGEQCGADEVRPSGRTLSGSQLPDYLPGPAEITEACTALRKGWTPHEEGQRWRASRRRLHLTPREHQHRQSPKSQMHLGLRRPAQEKTDPTEASALNWGWERAYRRSRRNPRWLGLGLLRRWIEEVSKRDAEAEAA